MPNYDFSTLSPIEFEDLSRDLLQKELEITLESFKSGKDQGIDFRCCQVKTSRKNSKNRTSALIVQAKHYQRSGFPHLKRILRSEIKKLHKLKPDRYLITTSVPLSPTQKDTLASELGEYCKSTADIFGANDLNNLLAKFPAIEQRHFKLWLPSTTVLTRLLNNGVFLRSALDEEDIKLRLSLFVPTPAVNRCQAILEDSGFCMLVGIPGIGKTTTAQIILAHHINEDWNVVNVNSNVAEAFEVYDVNEKQIFYYDDFLGQTGLGEKLAKNEDKDLNRLINACKKNNTTKRLLLTTREHLYQQAQQQHELLSRSKSLQTAACTVKLEDYTKEIRAKIIINHLYFYGIEPETCSYFVYHGFARKVLEHKNYNPRVIEVVCSLPAGNADGPVDFCQRFLQHLDSPDEIWSHAFHQQLTLDAQHLLLVFALLGDGVLLDNLRETFESFTIENDKNRISLGYRFENALKQLDGNFVAVRAKKGIYFTQYHNPAIKDFTDAQLRKEPSVLVFGIKHLKYDTPLRNAVESMISSNTPYSEENIFKAWKRVDYDANAYASPGPNDTVNFKSSTNKMLSLTSWLKLFAKLEDKRLLNRCLRDVEKLFQTTQLNREVVSWVIEAYESYISLCRHLSRQPTPSILAFAEAAISHCSEPGDYDKLREFLLKESLPKELLARLKERFQDDHWRWLDSAAAYANSSSEIQEAVSELLEAAENLGIDESDLDLDVVNERADELALHEDARAEMHEDDFRGGLYLQQEESQRVDDILDSMR